MSIEPLLHQIKSTGVSLHLEDGKLKLAGPSSAVARVKGAVLEYKADIIQELRDRAEGSNQGGAFVAEQEPTFEPLPGRYWIDPVVNGFRPNYETIQDRQECLGYPMACLRCRMLMADLETCLLL